MPTPRPIGEREDGTWLGELDGTLYVGTPVEITHADLVCVTSEDEQGRTVQEWCFNDQCFIRQSIEHDSWVADPTRAAPAGSDEETVAVYAARAEELWEAEISRVELPVVFTKGIVFVPGIVDGELADVPQLADVPLTITAINWKAM